MLKLSSCRNKFHESALKEVHSYLSLAYHLSRCSWGAFLSKSVRSTQLCPDNLKNSNTAVAVA